MIRITMLLLGVCSIAYAQNVTQNDTTINNLKHSTGYATIELGAIPEYIKDGKGRETLIIIPGLGFDATVFEDFVKANKKNFTMYVITLPGFGKTSAPPMPAANTSYGEQTWTKGVAQGISKLIKKEGIDKPIVVGHFVTGTQVALRFAQDYPEQLGGLIFLGGSAKMMAFIQGKLMDSNVKDMIKGTDTYWAPQWFKHMTKEFYNNGNFIPEVYSVNPATAAQLWQQVATTPMPISVRYACEYYACDMLAEIDKIKCPILVIRPKFQVKFWDNQLNKSWIQPQFIESWNVAAGRNPSIQIVEVPESGAFVWKDNPAVVYPAISNFLKSK